MKIKEKIIVVGEQRYKLTKLSADAGSYVAFKLAGVVLPLIQVMNGGESKNGEDEKKMEEVKLLSAAITSMSRTDFSEVQRLLLSTVLQMVSADGAEMPMPVLKADGSYANEELAADAATVIKLTIQAALFNVAGFFPGKELNLPDTD